MKLVHRGLRGTMIGLAALATGCGQSPVERPAVWLDASVALDTTPVDLTPPVDRPPAPPPDVPGASCGTAVEIHDGDVLRAQAFPQTPSTTPVCAGTLPPDLRVRWYRATVPAHNILQVTALQSWASGVAVVAVADCADTACLPTATESVGDGSVLLFLNQADAARSVLVAVTSSRPTPAAVDVAVYIRPAAPNSACASAMPLVPSVVLHDQDLGLTTGSLAGCGSGPSSVNPVLYYSLTVPPRTEVIVGSSEVSTNGQHTGVTLQPPCGEGSCLDGATHGTTPQMAYAQFNNQSDAPRAVVVTVTCDHYGGRPVFDLSTSLHALPTDAP